MLLVLIVVPSVVLVVSTILVLDRVGLLPTVVDPGHGRPARSGVHVPRVALVGGLVVMGAWVLVWLALLVVGLKLIAA